MRMKGSEGLMDDQPVVTLTLVSGPIL